MRSLFALCLVVASLAIVPGAAGAAQPTAPNPLNATETATATPEPNATAVDLTESIVIESWEYEDGEFRLTVRSQEATTVTMTDMAAVTRRLREAGGSSAIQIPRRTYAITPGTQTLTFDASTIEEEAAISVGAEGRLVLLRTGQIGGGPGTTSWNTAYAVAALAFVGGVGSVYRVASRQQDDDEPEIRRRL